MTSKKSKNLSKDSAEHIIQIRAKDMSLSREKKSSSCGCCGKKYVSLGFVGFALLAVGSLLVMARFSIRKITTSIALTQNTFPCYITGGVMAANGLLCMVMSKKRPRGLVILSIMTTIVASLLCFAGAVFSLTNVAPMLASFEKCQYFPMEFSCRCFYTSDLRQVSYIFRGTNNCKVVQFDLKNMVYGISGVYGAGLALCLVSGIMECLLMCTNRRPKRLSYRSRYEGDGKTDSTSRQSQTSQTNLTLSCSEAELIAAASNSSSAHASTSTASNTQPRRESQIRHEPQTACARQHTCSHYVVDLDPVPRRDYIINYNTASSRHDPPPPYTE